MSQKFKIIFAGTPAIAVKILNIFQRLPQYEIILVISQPNRAIGRHQSQIQPTPVATWARNNRIHLLQPPKINDIKSIIASTNANAFITCAYGQIIPESILNIPHLLFLNLHMSLLPQFRGAAPIIYAIWKQIKTTGVSLMKMVKKMDAGPIYYQEQVPVTSFDTQTTLTAKLIQATARIIDLQLPLVLTQTIEPIAQHKNKLTFAPSLTKADEKIDWNQSAAAIVAHIRAFSPTPIVFSVTDTGDRYKFWSAKIADLQKWPQASIGDVIMIDKTGLFIMAGGGVVQVLTLQKAGRKRQPAHLFTNLKGQHFTN